MSASVSQGGGAGDSDGGRPPKRPNTDKPTPEAGSPGKQGGAGDSDGEKTPKQQRTGEPTSEASASGEQRRDASAQAGPSGSSGGARGGAAVGQEAVQNGGGMEAMPEGAHQPGVALVIAPCRHHLPRQQMRALEKRHYARLVRHWEQIIRFYRNLEAEQQNVQAAGGAPGQVAALPAGEQENDPGNHVGAQPAGELQAGPGNQGQQGPDLVNALQEQGQPQAPEDAGGDGGEAPAEPRN